MTKAIAPLDARKRQAADVTHAYGHAAEVRPIAPHVLDVVDPPRRARERRRFWRAPAPNAPTGDGTLRHEVRSPVRTAFKLGFGFTAGVFSFRVLVFLVAGTLLLLATIRLLDFVSG